MGPVKGPVFYIQGHMATYSQRYGSTDIVNQAAIYEQPMGPSLGDPSKYAFKFLDGGCLWVATKDTQGRPWFILVGSPDGHSIVNAARLSKGTWGQPEAYAYFEEVERQNMDRAGLTWNPNQILMESPEDRRLHLYSSPYPDTAPNYEDKGLATVEQAAHVHRATVDCVFPKKGGGETTITCIVNPWLRIGYITSRLGERKGGDPVAEILLTIAEIVVAIIGIYTGNVGLITQAVAAITTTWYAWATADAKAATETEGWGKALAEAGRRVGEGPDVVLGAPKGQLLLGPGALALAQSPALQAIPHAGEVAAKEHASHVGGIVLLGLLAKVLLF